MSDLQGPFTPPESTQAALVQLRQIRNVVERYEIYVGLGDHDELGSVDRDMAYANAAFGGLWVWLAGQDGAKEAEVSGSESLSIVTGTLFAMTVLVEQNLLIHIAYRGRKANDFVPKVLADLISSFKSVKEGALLNLSLLIEVLEILSGPTLTLITKPHK